MSSLGLEEHLGKIDQPDCDTSQSVKHLPRVSEHPGNLNNIALSYLVLRGTGKGCKLHSPWFLSAWARRRSITSTRIP